MAQGYPPEKFLPGEPDSSSSSGKAGRGDEGLGEERAEEELKLDLIKMENMQETQFEVNSNLK